MAGETDFKAIRRYLLGAADDDLVTAVEERLIVEPAFFEEVDAEEWELIDDYIAGTLAEDEARAFETRFLSSPARVERIRLARTLSQRSAIPAGETPQEAPGGGLWNSFSRMFSSPLAYGAGLAALLIAVLVGGWYLIANRGGEDVVLAELNRAYSAERPLEARISGLEHAPKTDRRGGTPAGVDTLARNRAERIAADELAENDTDAARHRLARVFLAKGETGEALRLLERVTRQEPANAQAHNDLAVAYMASADALDADDGGRKLEFLALALDHLERASAAEPELAEPRFNRALVLSRMGTPAQEADAWRDYLRLDSTSPWAQEARERLSALENAPPKERSAAQMLEDLLAAHRQQDRGKAFETLRANREMITGKLIPQQLAFLFADAPDTKGSLEPLAFAGEVEFERTGDPFWREAAAFYKGLSEQQRGTLATAHARVRSGYQNSLDGEYDAALSDFEAAYAGYIKLGDIWDAAIAEYWLGYLLDRNGRLDEAEQMLASAARRAESRGHIWIASHHYAWLAQVAYARDRLSDRIRFGTEALALAERAFDDYNTQKSLELLASAHRDTAAFQDALAYADRSVRLSHAGASSPRQRFRTLSETAYTFANARLYPAAEAFERESLWVAENETDEGTFVYLSLLRLGQLASVRGDVDRAFEYFRRSGEIAGGFEPTERARHIAYLELVKGHAMRAAGRCAAAVAHYTAAADYYATDKFTTDHYDTQKGLLICHLNERDEGAVATRLPIVFGMLERYREEIREEAVRNSFFGREQEIYDALVDFEISRGNADQAFEHLERSRARSLLDSISGRVSDAALETGPRSLAETRAALPVNVQLVEYAVLPERVAFWVLRNDGSRHGVVDITRPRLAELAESYLGAVSKPGRDHSLTELVAKALSEAVFEPIRPHLDPQKAVVIVPDKDLARVPFSALRLDSGRFAVEEFEIHFAPSAAAFLTLASHRGVDKMNERLLAVGDPPADRLRYPALGPLPGASREVRDAAANYTSPVTFLNAGISKEKVLAELPESDIFHFAGHYVYDDRSAAASGLLLGPGDDGLLTNSEIAAHDLSRLRLVVLSACRTGSERVIAGEGMLGAAHAFLGAGIPLVIASHWEVDSTATAELMSRFHKLRKADGLSSIGALRRAQLAMLEHPRYRDPFFWAPFITYGAYVSY